MVAGQILVLLYQSGVQDSTLESGADASQYHRMLRPCFVLISWHAVRM